MVCVDTYPDPGEKKASYGAGGMLARIVSFEHIGGRLYYSSSPMTARNCRSCSVYPVVRRCPK